MIRIVLQTLSLWSETVNYSVLDQKVKVEQIFRTLLVLRRTQYELFRKDVKQPVRYSVASLRKTEMMFKRNLE